MTNVQTYGASVRRYEYRNAGVAAVWIAGAIFVALFALWSFNQLQARAEGAIVEAKSILANDVAGTLPTQSDFVTSGPQPPQTQTGLVVIAYTDTPETCTPELLQSFRSGIGSYAFVWLDAKRNRIGEIVGYSETCDTLLRDVTKARMQEAMGAK